MKTSKAQKERTLSDLELKSVQGGTTYPTPSPIPSDQNTDARAQLIETGEA